MTKDEWYDNLEVTNQLTLDNTSRVKAPNGKYLDINAMNGMTSQDDPILWLGGSLFTDNDLFVCGSITSTTDFASGKQSGGGALLLSHGWVGSGTPTAIALSPPLLELITSGTQIKSGSSLPSANDMTDQAGQIFNNTGDGKLYIWTGSSWIASETNFSGCYDTLFLVKSNGYSPANLDLGTLHVHDGLVIGGDTNLYRSAADTLKTDDTFVAANINQALTTSSDAIFNSVLAVSTVAGYKLGLANGTTYMALAYDASYGYVAAYGRDLYLATDSGKKVYVLRNLEVGGNLIGDGYGVFTGSVSETALGYSNIRFGIAGSSPSSPRLICESSGYTQWEIDNYSGTLRFFNPGAVRMSLSTSGDLTVGANIFPSSVNYGNIGTNTLYFGSLWANYLKYHTSCTAFDELDDLSLVKNYKTKTEKKTHPITKEEYEESVIAPESLTFLRDENGFGDYGKDIGFAFGCLKQVALKLDEHEANFEKIANMQTEVDDLRSQLNALKNKGSEAN